MPIIHQETFQEKCEKIPKFNLDLETLKYVKFLFEINSDYASTHNNGFDNLCRIIKEQEISVSDISGSNFKLQHKMCSTCESRDKIKAQHPCFSCDAKSNYRLHKDYK